MNADGQRTELPQCHIKLHNVLFKVNKFHQRCDESRLHIVQEVPLLHTANPVINAVLQH